MDCSKSKSYGKRKKEEVGEGMSISIQKYINLYYNKMVTKSVRQRYTNGQHFLDDSTKLGTYLLADALCNN